MHRQLLQMTRVRSTFVQIVALAWLALVTPALAQSYSPIMNYGSGPSGSGGGGGGSPCVAFGSTAGTCAQGNDTRIVNALQKSNNLSDVSSTSAALLNIGGIGAATLDTLTNKTISGSANTLTNIGNGSLVNSTMTIAGHSIALGGTQTLASTDLSNSSAIALLTAVQTFTNKSMDFSANTATKIPLTAFLNLGTTTTVMHGNAAGNPSFSAVGLTTDVTGQLPFANFNNIAANSIFGNNTGSSAVGTNLTPSQVLDIIGNTRGSLLYRGVAGWSILTPGTANFVLQTNGAGADPSWVAQSGGGGSISLTCGNGLLCAPSPITGTGSISPSITLTAKTGNYAIANTDGGAIITSTNAGAVADTIVASSNTGYGAGFGVDLYNTTGPSTTLTATSSVFDTGQSAIVTGIGQDGFVFGDGTNYHAVLSLPALANNTVLGNLSGHTEYPVGLTATQLTTLCNSFTSLLSGCVPASGGGTTNFLRADGSWAAPPGGGGGGITIGTTTITSGTNTRVLFDSSGVVSEYTISGTGNVAMTNSPTFVTPALGTIASGNLAAGTGYTVGNLAGAGSGILTWLATPSSANLASALTDETGSGAAVFAASPTLSGTVAGSFSLSGNLTYTAAGAASTPAALFNGALASGGTGTTEVPHMYFNFAGNPTTWNTGGTVLGANAPSSFSSTVGNFIDFHVNNGASIMSVTGNGTVTSNAGLLIAAGSSTFMSFNGRAQFRSLGAGRMNVTDNAGTGFSTFTLGAEAATTGIRLKPSNGLVAFRLGDDSADAAISSAALTASGAVTLSAVTTGTNADFLCMTAGFLVTLQSSACTISSLRFKEDVKPFTTDIIPALMTLDVDTFKYKKKNEDPNGNVKQLGLIAEDIAAKLPICAEYEGDMSTPKSYKQECMIAALVKATQEQTREITVLRSQIANDNDRIATLERSTKVKYASR